MGSGRMTGGAGGWGRRRASAKAGALAWVAGGGLDAGGGGGAHGVFGAGGGLGGGGGEGAEDGVEDEVGDAVGGGLGGVGFGAGRSGGAGEAADEAALLLVLDAGEVGAGNGEGAEDGGGVAAIEFAVGEEAEDLAEGALDGVEVFGVGEGELGDAVLGAVGVGAAAGVMEVAELLAAEGGAAALAALSEDMAAGVGAVGGGWLGGGLGGRAGELGGLLGGGGHGVGFLLLVGLNARGPAGGRAFLFSVSFNGSRLRVTHAQLLTALGCSG